MSEAPNTRAKGAPWRGRRRVADPKQRAISFRCTANNHAVIDEAATRAGLSIGAYLRTLALGSAGPRAVKRPPVERKELARLLGHLGRVGSNINQIAHACNRDRVLPQLSELVAIRREVLEMRAALLRALGHGD
jgi:Bacterial mobilisation protein (MobC)